MKILDNIKDHLLKKFDPKNIKDKKYFLDNINKNLNIIKNKIRSKSIILYGDVQSGKTKNLISLSAFLFEKNFNWIIILTGDRNSLDSQTYNRFMDAYKNIDGIGFFAENSKKQFYKLNPNKAFLVLKKQSKELKTVTQYAESFGRKIVVFDDECDHWSKENIVNHGFIDFFKYSKSKYIGISATPFWNIFSKYSNDNFKIKEICVLEYGGGYIGFHNFNNYKIMEFKECILREEFEKFDCKLAFDLINKIIKVFLDWMLDGKQNNELLINVSTKIKDHLKIREILIYFIKNILCVNRDGNKWKQNLKKFSLTDEQLYSLKKWHKLADTNILIDNSKFKKEEFTYNKNEKTVLIGGLTFSRGNTFEKLTDIIISKNENITLDVLMQAARWLGYKNINPNVYLERNILNKYKKIKDINSKIKEICAKSEKIEEIQNLYKDNSILLENLFDDKIEKSIIKKEMKEVKKIKSVLQENNCNEMDEEELINNSIISSKKTYQETKDIINKFSLENKNPNNPIIFNKSQIKDRKFVWLMENNLEIINKIYKLQNDAFFRKIELGENVAYESTWRKGHSQTAKILKNIHKRCAICELEENELLYASHIKKWKDCNKSEKVNYNNFLILCAGCDILFEKEYITFNKKGYLICIDKVLKWKEQFNFLFDKENNLKKIKLPKTYYSDPIDHFELINFLINCRTIKNKIL